MLYNLILDPRVEKKLNKLSKRDRAKIIEYSEYFCRYGFSLNTAYLKKITHQLWELRPGKWRLFFLHLDPNNIAIHLMQKKSQKITKKTKQLLKQRTKEYL